MAKNDNQKYWWIKLETNFFYQNAIDFLMSQKNGSQYVVLYQMLCLETANTNGRLMTEIGNIMVKYDVEKIRRTTRYFDTDTIVVALELYRQIGLVYEEEDGFLRINNHEKMIGFQTGAAKRMQESRAKESKKEIGTNQEQMFPRDKILDLKEEEYISKSNKEEKNTKKKTATKRKPNGNQVDVEPKLVYFTDLALNETFIAFLEMRKKLKAINSDLAINKLLNILEPYNDNEKMLMINNSIVNSWKGLFPIKHGNSKQSQKEQVMNDIDAALRQMKGR
ncbi:MAG: phage replisome organizer N-terminal domain-containing protein [Acholeplasmataceae bacterium]